MLSWQESGVQGLQLGKKGSLWVPTLVPTSAQARTERHANLTLSDNGDLEGKVTVTYTGLDAARWRLEERHADETERRKDLEDGVKGQIPASSEVKLTNQPDWKNYALPLMAELDLKIPGWASGGGRHLILPVGLFSAQQKHTFDHANRVRPIYVPYPFTEMDDIDIQIPSGWHVSSLPPAQHATSDPVNYSLSAQNDDRKIHLSRQLSVDFILIEVKFYAALRYYFQTIKAGDGQQIVLEGSSPRASN